MRIAVMAAVVAGIVGCGPASVQTAPTATTSTTASPLPLTLETAGCAESVEGELPDAESIREARATDPDAYGPTDVRVLLEGGAAEAAEVAVEWPDDGIAGLKAQQWRDLVDALGEDPVGAEGSDRFRRRVGGMELRAVRIADVWFIASETHAMPDSYCEDDDPEAAGAVVAPITSEAAVREAPWRASASPG